MFIWMMIEEYRRDPLPLTGGWLILWLGFGLCFWGISGYVFGSLMWRKVERAFHSNKEV